MNRPFGTLSDGRAVTAYTIAAGDLRAEILDFGAILRDVRLAGVDRNLTLGSDELAPYEGVMTFYGAVIGPVANRIRNARFTLNGVEHRTEPNQDATHTLHSGAAGTNRKLWQVADHQPDSLTLTTDLPDGEGGFPGNRQVRVTYRITPPARLSVEIEALTDADTVMNIAHHGYWRMGPRASVAGDVLWVDADRYLPVDDATCPTGEVASVAGTGLDFAEPRAVVPGDPPLDHNFCLNGAGLRDVCRLKGSDGVTLTVQTDQPGLQIFDGRNSALAGFAPYAALAIEPQGWPDAMNQPDFPPIVLRAGQTYRQHSAYVFDRA